MISSEQVKQLVEKWRLEADDNAYCAEHEDLALEVAKRRFASDLEALDKPVSQSQMDYVKELCERASRKAGSPLLYEKGWGDAELSIAKYLSTHIFTQPEQPTKPQRVGELVKELRTLLERDDATDEFSRLEYESICDRLEALDLPDVPESLLLSDEEINNVTHVADDSGVPINENAFYGIELSDLRLLVKAAVANALAKIQATPEEYGLCKLADDQTFPIEMGSFMGYAPDYIRELGFRKVILPKQESK